MIDIKEVKIVFENEDFLAINKPSGISVQDERDKTGILPIICQQTGYDRLWLVHRLDKVTSGLLLLAKHQQSAARLSGYFADRKISKYYVAITDKKPKKKQGAVIGDMHKIRDGKWALSTTKVNPAISQFFSTSLSPGLRLNLVKPSSGKTHQIRVMCKSLGSPILGDTLYSGTPSDRTYLHAYCLDFIDQANQIRLVCEPESGNLFKHSDYKQSLSKFSTPWDIPWPQIGRNK